MSDRLEGVDRQRWRRIDSLFEAVLDLPVGERAAFLERSCGDDVELRREVESLLAHDREEGDADGFLAAPAAGLLASQLTGRSIGSFEVLESLGRGGMGEVYAAIDHRLGRRVAIKRIPAHLGVDPDRIRRFRQEALATSALNHPNILTVFEVVSYEGGDLLVTELVDGVSLRQRMEAGGLRIQDALAIVLQASRGIAAAHAQGIVHRDVKPENLMIRHDGLVKVLDFGIAKSLRPTVPSATLTTVTGEGTMLGTVGYMSPEQARGLPVDARSDVWSLGVVLYELLTGASPFPGDTESDRLVAILDREPVQAPLDERSIPRPVRDIVLRCLQKTPSERFASAQELAAALERADGGELVRSSRRWIRPGFGAVAAALLLVLAVALSDRAADRKADPPRLAVLPFEDLGGPADSYFAAGLTEELISGLAMVPGMDVISRTTVTQLERTGKTVRRMGRELGVDYVLEGTVRWGGAERGTTRVRITPQLIRVADDTHVWAGSYERDLADVFAVQSDIAAQVVGALGVTLSTEERRLVTAPPTRNPEAYQLYLRGLSLLAADRHVPGAELMRRAAELDPGFSLALAREASAYSLSYLVGGRPEDLERARAALARAQALAPEDPRVRLAAGRMRYHGDRDYQGALREFEAAARAMPRNAEIPGAIAAVLRRLGRFDEAVVQFERARRLEAPDPINVDDTDRDLAETLWALRRYAEADRIYEASLRAAPDRSGVWDSRARLHLHWKGPAAARAVLAAAAPSVLEELTSVRALIALCERRFDETLAIGEPRRAAIALDPLHFYVALAYARLDRREEAATVARQALARIAERSAGKPASPMLESAIGLHRALLGDGVNAVASAESASRRLPTSDDALWGPVRVEWLAAVHALSGNRDAALALLPELLERNYERPLNPQRLRNEPWWDSLRVDPRFEALLR